MKKKINQIDLEENKMNSYQIMVHTKGGVVTTNDKSTVSKTVYLNRILNQVNENRFVLINDLVISTDSIEKVSIIEKSVDGVNVH